MAHQSKKMTQELTNHKNAEQAYLEALRTHSVRVCSVLGESLGELDMARFGVSTVFAVGSVGRLEVGENSDVDGVVVLEDELTPAQFAPLMTAIESCYAGAGLRIAKGTGIYRQPVTKAALLDECARGSMSELPGTYGKRIQILLDARALYQPAAFHELQQKVLQWFLPAQHGRLIKTSFLLAELKRYYNAYSSWQNFKFDKSDDDGWLLRQGKLKVTRATTIMAMVLLAGAASDEKRRIPIGQHLSLTPLERVQTVFRHYDEQDEAVRYSRLYSSALELISDAEVRRKLINASPAGATEVAVGFPREFTQICAIGDEMSEAIARFILRRQHDWPIAFYRQALF